MSRLLILAATVALAAAACTTTGATNPTTGPTAAPAGTAVAAATEAPSAAPVKTSAPTDGPQIDVGVSWDGKTCAYTGPTDVPRGARMTFAMTNTAAATANGRDAAVLVFFAVDPGTTAADFDAWKVKHPKGSEIPPWVHQAELIGPLYPDAAATGDTMSHVMTADEYMVICGESPKDGEAVHLAAILETKDR